ncbi:hypothetical protein RchiOBHm_Chr4g0401101 [Rosa chinensis]|uniref:Uncharacterized protein n=1 Tax=Rosa chinensis TaxID=74649 RepID=A0A2P6QSZ4_ROSCH|nr:hypothetical protein RchiOBHm_Chr4g0401101 [Rosa chinensis]
MFLKTLQKESRPKDEVFTWKNRLDGFCKFRRFLKIFPAITTVLGD